MPQLYKWLDETGPDGADAWCVKLIERFEATRKEQRRGVFRELMATDHEFEQLVREQDDFERTYKTPLRDDIRKDASERVRRISSILDQAVADKYNGDIRTDVASPYGPVDTTKAEA